MTANDNGTHNDDGPSGPDLGGYALTRDATIAPTDPRWQIGLAHEVAVLKWRLDRERRYSLLTFLYAIFVSAMLVLVATGVL
jgi:hypothetical protein